MGRRLCKAVVFAAVCLGSPPAPAQIIYKCIAENGKITYGPRAGDNRKSLSPRKLVVRIAATRPAKTNRRHEAPGIRERPEPLA